MIDDTYSRYSNLLAQLATDFYARLPEREALELLKKTLNIDLEKDSLVNIGSAIAQGYKVNPNEETEYEEIIQPENGELSFIIDRIREIDTSEDRETIILDALEKGVEGIDCKEADALQTVTYIEVDGTGVSGLPRELSDKGKNGGPAKTFEAKIGVIFKQSFDANGLPLLNNNQIYREPKNTKYMGTTHKVGMFIKMFSTFLSLKGVCNTLPIVFLSDGAIWLENLRLKLFPNSIGIVDIFHALEHLTKLLECLYFDNKDMYNEFSAKCIRLLELGNIDELIALVMPKIVGPYKKAIMKKLTYFTGNKEKMRYGLYRAAGLFIGSGVIESACKCIVEHRLNGSGMRWTKKNAENVIALRCAIYSDEYKYDAA
jgi:hypothetical protein